MCGVQLRLILLYGPHRSICLPSLTSSSCSFPRIRLIDLGLFFFFSFGLQKSSLVYMLREEELGRYCCISSLWLTLPLLRGQLHIRETLTDNLYPSVSFFLNFQYHPSFRSDHSSLFKGEGVNFSVTRVTRWNCKNNDSLFCYVLDPLASRGALVTNAIEAAVFSVLVSVPASHGGNHHSNPTQSESNNSG